jgi:hypothetical protein
MRKATDQGIRSLSEQWAMLSDSPYNWQIVVCNLGVCIPTRVPVVWAPRPAWRLWPLDGM